MKKKLASFFLALAMILTLLPTGVLAADTEVTLDITKGDIEITDAGVISGKDPGGIAQTGVYDSYVIVGAGVRTTNHIRVAGTVAITLDNVNIRTYSRMVGTYGANTYAMLVDEGGDVTVSLKGANSLVSCGRYAGLTVHDGATVTIVCPDHPDGTCNKTVSETVNGVDRSACTNTLHAEGSSTFVGEEEDQGGMTVVFEKKYGAPGIGGVSGTYMREPGELPSFSDQGSMSGGTINIRGGVINAQSAEAGGLGYGAAIGSGAAADRTRPINISGGYVVADNAGNNCLGAGIGGGATSDAGEINITGNARVFAFGGLDSAGIGGGGGNGIQGWNSVFSGNGAGGVVTIGDSAWVESTGGTKDGAGIGGGGNALDQALGGGGYEGGAELSIAKTAEVRAYSAANLPAIHSKTAADQSAVTAADILNHRIKVTLNSSAPTSVQLFYQGVQDPEGEPTQDEIADTVTVPKGYRNFALTVDERGVYTEKISVPTTRPAFTQMGHLEDVEDIYFVADENRGYVDVVYHMPTLKVSDVTIHYGEEVTMTAESLLVTADNPIVSYQWEHYEEGFFVGWGSWNVLAGETDQTLTFTPPDVYDSNYNNGYRCKATLQDGTVIMSNTGYLTVLAIPMLLTVDDVRMTAGDPTPPLPAIEYDRLILGDTPETVDYYDIDRNWPKLSEVKVAYQDGNGNEVADVSTLPAGVYPIVITTNQHMGITNLLTVQNYIMTTVNGRLIIDDPAAPLTVAVLIKTDADDSRKRLENAEFELWLADGTRYGDQTYTTDANGEITLRQLPYGEYYWKEITAPQGYAASAEQYPFTLSAGDLSAKVTATNRNAEAFYTVTFDSQGGSSVPSQRLDRTGPLLVTKPGDPTYAGYTFNGWYTAPTGGDKWNFDTDRVPGDMTLYARWTRNVTPPSPGGDPDPSPAKEYTLTFVTNGGSKVPSEKHSANTTVQLTQLSSWDGHTFLGWYSDVHLTNKITSIKMTGDKTVYAKWDPAHDSVPGILNGDDHFSYIIGFDDGMVRPTANITRAEVATIFFRLLKDEVRQDNMTSDNRFSDVNGGQWYNNAISTIAQLGIVKGRGNGSFDPGANITRAEFAAIAARFDSTPYTGADQFPDIADSWAREEINRAAARGWVKGDGSGGFRPGDYITRAEAVTLINRVLARDPQSAADLLGGMVTWPDNMDTSAWYYLAVQEATNSHDFDRKSGGTERWTQLTANRDWSALEH